VRISRRSPRRMLKMVALLGAGLAVASLAWGVGMYFLPDSAGRALLKRTWPAGHAVILPLALAWAASGVLTGATVGLRALAAAKRSLRARLITGALSLAGTAAGAYLADARGAALGLALGLWAGSILWWRGLEAEVTEAERRLAAPAQSGRPRRRSDSVAPT
jgi:hypothetical protein